MLTKLGALSSSTIPARRLPTTRGCVCLCLKWEAVAILKGMAYGDGNKVPGFDLLI